MTSTLFSKKNDNEEQEEDAENKEDDEKWIFSGNLFFLKYQKSHLQTLHKLIFGKKQMQNFQ